MVQQLYKTWEGHNINIYRPIYYFPLIPASENNIKFRTNTNHINPQPVFNIGISFSASKSALIFDRAFVAVSA